MIEFTVAQFLRLIGKGPEQKPEWWRENYFVRDGCIPMCPREFICIAPFADILDAWTPEKDALLLGVGLEYCRSVAGPRLVKVSSMEGLIAVRIWNKLSELGESWYSLCFHCDRPGLTLARAIWAAMKGGEQ
jgi:hypothetical protein